jgi:GMP synthase-like glutamine amidotransferase
MLRSRTSMRPIAILRFSETEGPAYFAEWLDAASLPWHLIAIDRGDPIPADPRAFSGVAMMGGPMSVNDSLEWIGTVLRLVREAMSAQVPVLGHCLGGQLLAKALGARVTRSLVPEIGWGDVEAPDAAAREAWFGGRARFRTFQWHFETFDIPGAATRVLTNAFNRNQAFVVDGRHIGLQCHVEMTADLVRAWCDSGARDMEGPGTPARQSRTEILRDLDARIADLQSVARDVYTRWTQGLSR